MRAMAVLLALAATAVLPDVAAQEAPTASGSADAPSRVQLDATAIRGSDELPQVLHILPWQSADAAALAGRPMRSLIDEILMPVDPEVLRREVSYHEQLQASPASTDAAAPNLENDRP